MLIGLTSFLCGRGAGIELFYAKSHDKGQFNAQ